MVKKSKRGFQKKNQFQQRKKYKDFSIFPKGWTVSGQRVKYLTGKLLDYKDAVVLLEAIKISSNFPKDWKVQGTFVKVPFEEQEISVQEAAKLFMEMKEGKDMRIEKKQTEKLQNHQIEKTQEVMRLKKL